MDRDDIAGSVGFKRVLIRNKQLKQFWFGH